ncbi:MAG: hypothetical protein IKV93_02505 [Alphaproteobacteria bacterium]|nr:hypothetical protein [Alphaproteobacteria bacterium]
MRNKIDNILIGMVWLLSATLATFFWFNIRFGFDLFSSAHWNHLAELQAKNQSVSPCFYISLVVAIVITLVGLHFVIRPRRRNITLSHPAPTPVPTHVPVVQSAQPTQSPYPQETSAPEPAPLPAGMIRPPRLNIAPSGGTYAGTSSPSSNAPVAPIPMAMQAPAPNTSSSSPRTTTRAPQKSTPQDWPQIREIFSMAGYIIKPEPYINSTKMALCAIGTDEVFWIGAVGISKSAMQEIYDKLEKLFQDTLEEVPIQINAFVMNASDAPETSTDGPVMTFDGLDSLRSYVRANPNKPLPPEDTDNFDAYSEYITTVIDYIGKL